MRRRMLLVVILILAILLQCVIPFNMVYAEESVGVTLNSKLYTAVKKSLEKQGITVDYRDASRTIIVTREILDSVTRLDLSNGEIDDLTGLDAFKNLTVLNLHANELTVDSNLEVLNNMSLLRDLDLSSNKLESIKSITNFKNIADGDITNQRVKESKIITVDTSSEAETREKTVIVDLPDILLEEPNGVNPEWFTKTIEAAEGGSAPDAELIEEDGVVKLKLKIADGSKSDFKALKGLVRIEINVDESASKLANTQMIYNFIIIDQDEVGIIFKDENCYKAVKKQLERNQVVNKEITVTSSRKLYERCYDDALILVIKKDDVYNNIPSLILHDQMIEDLTGIEQFVGLKSYLDISHNYLDTAEVIIKLEENKAIAEADIRARYQKTLDDLKTQVNSYDQQMKIYEDNKAKAAEAEEQLKKIEASATDARLNKANEMQDYLNTAEEASQAAERHKVLIEKYTEKLYQIYKNEYKLLSLLPIDVADMSYNDIINASSEEIKAKASEIMTKISGLEKNSGLSTYESWAIGKLLKQWGEGKGWEFKTTKKVQKVDPSNGDIKEEQQPIEFPISEFFTSINQDNTLDMTAYEEFVYIFKAIDTLSQLENYSMIERTFSTVADKDSRDLAGEALNFIKETIKSEGSDDYFYSKVTKVNYSSLTQDTDCSGNAKDSTEAYVFETQSSDFVKIKIGLGDKEYKGKLDGTKLANYKLLLAHKLNNIDGTYLDRYIYLPRIQKLNLAHNNIETLQGLDALKELKELNAYKNGINDISTGVDWNNFVKLEVLNLGFNQISDIEPLEVLVNLRELDVSSNLLAGRFTFSMVNMENLKKANFSHNQYNDIGYLKDQFRLKAFGKKQSVGEYLKSTGIDIKFQYQELEMSVTIIKTDEEFVEIEIPLIFRQLEEMDHENTSFGYSSKDGLVDAKGEYVKLQMPENEGKYQGCVTVDGQNGYDPGYTDKGIGFGTSCVIKYSVSNGSVIPDINDNPGTGDEDPNNPSEDPENPTNPEDPGKPEQYGYDVEGEYILVYEPETTLVDFMKTLVDTNKYNAVVTENESNNVSTGATVTITNKAGDKEYDIFEIVVKGDVNGDGVINALDSGIIKQYINDTRDLVGVYNSAADVNNDGNIDSLDSMFVLQYRADRIENFEGVKGTDEEV